MLQIKAVNLGPIARAEIEIKPLTILVGKNNSGKSYLCQAFYALLEGEKEYLARSYFTDNLKYPEIVSFFLAKYGRRLKKERRLEFNTYDYWLVDEEFKKNFSSKKKRSSVEKIDVYLKVIPTGLEEGQTIILNSDGLSFFKTNIQKILNGFGRRLNNEIKNKIEECYGTTLNELIKTDTEFLELSLNSDNYSMIFKGKRSRTRKTNDKKNSRNIKESELKIKLISEIKSIKVFNQKTQVKFKVLTNIKKEKQVFEFIFKKMSTKNRKKQSSKRIALLLKQLEFIYASMIFYEITYNRFYLPAARSGILQAHRSLSAAIVRSSQKLALSKYKIPPLSGIVSDFLAFILNYPDYQKEKRRGWYRRSSINQRVLEVVEYIEEHLIGGKVEIVTYEEGLQDIEFKQKNISMSLQRASSMVSEITPFLLYLKGSTFSKNNILIFEEPESHLHPEAQRILARAIVRLVNAGIKLIITTHSDYFLDQINNLILLYNKDSKLLKKYKYEPIETLDPEKVNLYLLKYSSEKKGTISIKIPVSQKTGFEEDTFHEVIEQLYNETADLLIK